MKRISILLFSIAMLVSNLPIRAGVARQSRGEEGAEERLERNRLIGNRVARLHLLIEREEVRERRAAEHEQEFDTTQLESYREELEAAEQARNWTIIMFPMQGGGHNLN